MGDLFALHDLEVPAGVELRHQIDGRAAIKRRQEGHDRCVGIQRRRQQRAGVIVISVGRHAVHLRRPHPVIVQDALGRAGRARGIDQVERIRHLDLDFGVGVRSPVNRSAIRLKCGMVEINGKARQIQISDKAIDQFKVLRRDKDRARAAVGQHLLQRIGRRHRRQRRHAGPCPQDAHKQLCVGDGIGRDDRDVVALAHPHRQQQIGDLVDALVECPPADGLPVTDQRKFFRMCFGVVAHDLDDGFRGCRRRCRRIDRYHITVLK